MTYMILMPGKESLVAVPVRHGTGLLALSKDLSFYAMTHEVIKMDCSTMRLSITIVPLERFPGLVAQQT